MIRLSKSFLKKVAPFGLIFIFVIFYIMRAFYPGILHYGEEQALINYDYVNWRYSSLWTGSMNFGSITPFYFVVITLGTIWRLANFIHLDLVTSQHLYYFIILVATASFFYLFINELSHDKVLALLLSFIYITTYNYYSSIDTSPRLLQYLIIPAFLWCWERYVKTNQMRYLLFNIFLIMSTLSIAINPPQMIGAYAVVMSYIVLFYTKRKHIIHMSFFIVSYVLTILLVMFTNFLVINHGNNLFGYDPLAISWSSTISPLHDILRFFGSWGDYTGSGLIEHYNHLFDYYQSPHAIIASFIPFLALLLLLFIKSYSNRLKKAKIIVWLMVFVFLTKGTTQPFSYFFSLIYKINVLRILREPWAKFIIDVIFIIYTSIALLWPRKSKLVPKVLYCLLIIYFIFQVNPLVKGEALDHRYIDWKIEDVKIPQYWTDLYQYSKQHLQNKRVLVLPASLQKGEQLTHTWTPYHFKGSPEQFFLKADIVTNVGNDANELTFMNQFYTNLTPNLISYYGVDYILNKKDVEIDSQKTVDIDRVKGVIDSLSKVTFGPLDLYRVNSLWHQDKIRSVEKVVQTASDCDLHSHEISRKGEVLVAQKDSTLFHTSFVEVPVHSKKIDNTTYDITLPENNFGTIGLLFTDSYNDGWNIYRSNTLFSKPIQNVKHYSANCFQNFWVMSYNSKKPLTHFYIHFTPETEFTYIKIIYLLFLLIVCVQAYAYSKKHL